MQTAIGKIARTLAAVTPVQGAFHALKVAFGPTLNACGLWPMKATDLELLYWERQVIGVGADADRMRVQLDVERHDELVPRDIRPFLTFIPPGGQVLDVGAGPVSLLSGGHHRGQWSLTATDLLADSYHSLLRAYGYGHVTDRVRYVASPGEELADRLPSDFFDFISMNNALDHTSSPRDVIAQMVGLAKRGGHILITGHACEGTHEKWKGMHQHDLWVEGRNLWRCGPHGSNAQVLNEGLPLTFVSGIDSKDRNKDMAALFRRD